MTARLEHPFRIRPVQQCVRKAMEKVTPHVGMDHGRRVGVVPNVSKSRIDCVQEIIPQSRRLQLIITRRVQHLLPRGLKKDNGLHLSRDRAGVAQSLFSLHDRQASLLEGIVPPLGLFDPQSLILGIIQVVQTRNKPLGQSGPVACRQAQGFRFTFAEFSRHNKTSLPIHS